MLSDTQDLEIKFTGSGREYFRIWIVNLLLILVSLTLYWPYARERRIRYFQNHTLIGGEPLGFHGDPRKMFRGYLVVVLMVLVYSATGTLLPQLTWLSTALLAACAPLLWQAALRFRLHNTSWRGIRFRFTGEARPAYWVIVPFFLPMLVTDLLSTLIPDSETVSGGLLFLGLFLLGMLIFGCVAPWLFYRLKQYQYGGYGFIQERLQFLAGPQAFYRVFLNTFWLALRCIAVICAGILLISLALALLSPGPAGSLEDVFSDSGCLVRTLLLVVFMPLVYLLWPTILSPYFTAHMQNLLWSHSQSEQIRFSSTLRFKDLCQVSLRNWLLIVLTLGLYWPFARIHLTRVRLEAIAVHLSGELESWIASARPEDRGAIGDAADDFLGLDIGL